MDDFVFLVQTQDDRAASIKPSDHLSIINKQVALRSHKRNRAEKKQQHKKNTVVGAQQIPSKQCSSDSSHYRPSYTSPASNSGFHSTHSKRVPSVLNHRQWSVTRPFSDFEECRTSNSAFSASDDGYSLLTEASSSDRRSPGPFVSAAVENTSQYLSRQSNSPSIQLFDSPSEPLSSESRTETYTPNTNVSTHNDYGSSEASWPSSLHTKNSLEDPANSTDSLLDCYSGLRTDPFLCMPVQDSSVVLSVAQKYTTVIIPNFRPIAKVFNVQDSYADLFWELVFDEDTVDAVMAMVHGNESNMRKSANCLPSKELFVHLGKALKKLQRRLVDNRRAASTSTIAMLLYTAGVSRHLGDFQAFEKYKIMIRSLLASMDGVDSLIAYGGKVKCILLQWNFFWTLNGGSSLFEAVPIQRSRYPTLPLSYDLCDLVRDLPIGFVALAESGSLSIQVLQLLERVNQLLLSTQDNSENQRYLDEPLVDAKLDFESAVPCLAANDSEGPSLEKALCLALILFSTNTMNPIKPKKSVWGQVAVGSRAWLSAHLPNIEVTSPLREQCLVWIWLIAIDSWGTEIGNLQLEGLFLFDHFRDKYPYLAMCWLATSKIAERYFWSEDLDLFCKSIWSPPG